ncbi:elicitor-responsive protein 3 [Corylus avellana]|uniref:elicitor-responsive protein 3 n=1 Tax=Corylus avellana TaxID=13451 RepID=UPI001E234139|nr:elicitor-responsive protein 3 [Corylus avellana]
MPQGTLEVLLVSAKGLENTDYLNDMDPYVILICRTQEQKSSVASGKGTEPDWNENFVFTISDDVVSELTLKIMDSDAGTGDDFVGEANISLEPLFMEGSLPPTAYNVVKDEEFRGEIRVALTFTPVVHGGRDLPVEEESYGGWKESAYRE